MSMPTLSFDANPFTPSPADTTETPPPPAPAQGPATYLDDLLKRPDSVRRALEAGDGLTARARTYVQVLIAGTATFGAALGFYRGGAQILFAAVKLPLVTLLMLATVAPLLHALNRALERPANMAREVTLLIAALARGALVLAAETPLIWAAHAVGADYHDLVVLSVLTCALAGIVSFWFLWTALSVTRRSRWLVTFILVVTMGVVGTQATWILRPYLVRPRATDVVFVHPLEGSFSEAARRFVLVGPGDLPMTAMAFTSALLVLYALVGVACAAVARAGGARPSAGELTFALALWPLWLPLSLGARRRRGLARRWHGGARRGAPRDGLADGGAGPRRGLAAGAAAARPGRRAPPLREARRGVDAHRGAR